MDQSTSSQHPFSKFPPKIYQSILAEVAEKHNSAIEEIQDLPKNGRPRRNGVLARLLTVDKSTQQALECVTWKRVGIFSVNHESRYAHKNRQKLMEQLHQGVEANKRHIKSLEVCLSDRVQRDSEDTLDLAEELLPHATRIFESVPQHQIEEVHIHICHHTDAVRQDPHPLHRLEEPINKLFAPIPAFKNLLRIHITSEPTPKAARLDYTMLANIFLALPIVQSIGLYRIELYDDYYEGMSDDSDPIGHEKLGRALASRLSLKTLILYYFTGPSEDWLKMEWLAPLEELAVAFTPFRLQRIQSQTLSPYVRFLDHFHQTLVSLHLTEENHHPKLLSGEKAIAHKFKSLKHITYGAGDEPFTATPFIALLPCVESFYLINIFYRNDDWKSAKFQKTKKARDGPFWPALKEVYHSLSEPRRDDLAHFKKMLERNSVNFSWASLLHYNWREKPIASVTGARHQDFFYPHSGFRARLGLDHLER